MPCAGFYLDPPVWVSSPPPGWKHNDTPSPAPWLDPPFLSFREEVFRGSLPLPVAVRITREGLFSFDFTGWRPADAPEVLPDAFDAVADLVLARARLMNAFLAFLFTAKMRLERYDLPRMVVTPDVMIDGVSLEEVSGGSCRSGVFHLLASSSPSTYQYGVPYGFDGRVSTRSVISLEAVTEAMDGLRVLVEQGRADGLVLADLFLRASKAYQEHDYSLSLITHWAIIERLLVERWEQYQADNDRSRGDFTAAAVLIELLSVGGYLSHDLYLKLGHARRSRNKWIHHLKPASYEDAYQATSACEALLLETRGIALVGAAGLRL
jgi:hypothetical protein